MSEIILREWNCWTSALLRKFSAGEWNCLKTQVNFGLEKPQFLPIFSTTAQMKLFKENHWNTFLNASSYCLFHLRLTFICAWHIFYIDWLIDWLIDKYPPLIFNWNTHGWWKMKQLLTLKYILNGQSCFFVCLFVFCFVFLFQFVLAFCVCLSFLFLFFFFFFFFFFLIFTLEGGLNIPFKVQSVSEHKWIMNHGCKKMTPPRHAVCGTGIHYDLPKFDVFFFAFQEGEGMSEYLPSKFSGSWTLSEIKVSHPTGFCQVSYCISWIGYHNQACFHWYLPNGTISAVKNGLRE